MVIATAFDGTTCPPYFNLLGGDTSIVAHNFDPNYGLVHSANEQNIHHEIVNIRLKPYGTSTHTKVAHCGCRSIWSTDAAAVTV